MLSFMLPPFFLSMFSSNTGSTALMLPIAMASMEATIRNAESNGDTDEVKALHWFEKGLYMSIAYSSTIGGTATIIATPPNAIVVATAENAGYPEVTFAQWMGSFMGLAICLEAACFAVMFFTYGRQVRTIDRKFIETEYAKLGPMNRDEVVVLLVFTVLVLWMILESFTTKEMFGQCTRNGTVEDHISGKSACLAADGKFKSTFGNGSIAIVMGLVLFFIPSVIDRRRNLLTWKQASAGVPWGLMLLLGSGNALSLLFDKTKTTTYLATFLEPLAEYSLFALTLIVTTVVALITELASNTATTNILLPIFLEFANLNNRHPLILAIPTALAASMAFMLPIATPPNAVVLGTGKVAFTGFVRAGWKMNLIGIALTTLFVCTVGNWMFGFDDTPKGYQKDWACRKPNATMACPGE